MCRFSEVAKLLKVWWLEIKGVIDAKELTLKTRYDAHFKYRLGDDSYGSELGPVEVPDKFASHAEPDERKNVYLEMQEETVVRRDGWMEIKMGISLVTLEVMVGWRCI